MISPRMAIYKAFRKKTAAYPLLPETANPLSPSCKTFIFLTFKALAGSDDKKKKTPTANGQIE
jgi:hypothetical protein